MASQGFACGPDVEPQARLWAGADPDGTEFVAVLVDPRARDSELGGERPGVDKPPGGGHAAAGAHQLDHPPRDRLHGDRFERDVGVGVCVGVAGFGAGFEPELFVDGHHC
jgi:hypothetical protein